MYEGRADIGLCNHSFDSSSNFVLAPFLRRRHQIFPTVEIQCPCQKTWAYFDIFCYLANTQSAPARKQGAGGRRQEGRGRREEKGEQSREVVAAVDNSLNRCKYCSFFCASLWIKVRQSSNFVFSPRFWCIYNHSP